MKFLLADDHSIVRLGVRLLVENAYPDAIIEDADEGNTVMEKAKNVRYDLIILDFQMPATDIFGVINYLLARDEMAKILVYTMASEKLYAPKLFRVGVRGFLSKEAENSEILKAIQTLLGGLTFGAEKAGVKNAAPESSFNDANPFSLLSPKELDVLHFLIQGKNTKEISNLSHLQMSTISTNKIRIFRKLNVNNLVELVALANEHHL